MKRFCMTTGGAALLSSGGRPRAHGFRRKDAPPPAVAPLLEGADKLFRWGDRAQTRLLSTIALPDDKADDDDAARDGAVVHLGHGLALWSPLENFTPTWREGRQVGVRPMQPPLNPCNSRTPHRAGACTGQQASKNLNHPLARRRRAAAPGLNPGGRSGQALRLCRWRQSLLARK